MNGGALTVGPIGHATHITQPVTAEVFPVMNNLFNTQGQFDYDGQSGRVLVYGLPTLTSVTPDKDSTNGTTAVSFTLTGTNFGTSQAGVNGEVRFIQVNENEPNNPWGTVYNPSSFTSWGNTSIAGSINLPAGKYRIEVSVRGENTTETVFFYKGTGTYEVIVGGTDYSFKFKWGTQGIGDGQFNIPTGIVISPSGYVYVAEPGNNRIQKFDLNGNYITKWGSSGSGNNQFNNLGAMALDSSENIYVADRNNNHIVKYDSNGTNLAIFNSGGLWYPEGVAVDSSGNFYVGDSHNRCVKKFSPSGTLISTWGQGGSGDGEFAFACNIALDSNGYAYVSDPAIVPPPPWDLNHIRIQKFTTDGVFTGKFGSYGTNNDQFIRPWGLAISNNEFIFVGDLDTHFIKKFTLNGTYITTIGSSGNSDGQFNSVGGIAIGPDGSIYAADRLNHRIQVFAPNN